jgi:hypothetical protein
LLCHIEGDLQLRVLKNRVLRRIFRPKRNDMTAEWRRIYCMKRIFMTFNSPDIIRVTISTVRGAGYLAFSGDRRDDYRVLV